MVFYSSNMLVSFFEIEKFASLVVVSILATTMALFASLSFDRGEKGTSLEAFADYDSDASLTTKYLSQEHLEPIALRQWKTVLSWVAFHPNQVAKLRDTKGQTVLHHAALFRAPVHVMESLLWAAPELASIPNQDGELALHWAVRLSTPNPVLALLLEANPDTAFWEDHQKTTPLSLLWERHQTGLLQAWRRFQREKLSNEWSNTSWKRVLSILRAVHEAQSLSSTRRFLPLHIAASRPSPPCLFPFMIQVYKEHLSVKDNEGKLPLAIACQSPTVNQSCDVLTKIQLLLPEYPAAAKCQDPVNGQYPLHAALSSGVSWNDGIQTLLHAFPVALCFHDPLSGLFPFALAAMHKKSNHTGYAGVERGDSDLSTIYSLLREDPSVIKMDKC
jgi:hypothetical protein